MLKYFLHNSKKSQNSPENDFFNPNIGQITDVNLSKSVDFWVQFRTTSPIFGLLVLRENLKSFPLLAKNIYKKGVKTFCFSPKKICKGKYAVHPPTNRPAQ